MSSTEKDPAKISNLPEILISIGLIGAVIITAFINPILAGYLLCGILIVAGVMFAISRR